MPESPDAQMMMALAADIEDAYQLSRRIEQRRQLVAQLPQVQAALPSGAHEPQTVYARPVEDSQWELTHFERYGPWYLVGGALTVVGLMVVIVWMFINWLGDIAESHAVGIGAFAVVVLAGVVLLAMLRGGRGGSSFSGTFEGTFH